MEPTRHAPTATDRRPAIPLKLLCLGLPRSGTTSLAAALTILGFQGVHQGSTMPWKDYDFFDRAADASFPNLPSYNGKGGLSQQEWDELYAPSEAVIEPAGLFAKQLIQTYPEARVIVTKRPYKIWAQSFDKAILQPIFPSFVPVSVLQFFQSMLSYKVWSAIYKMILGHFGATDYKSVKQRMPIVYHEHHKMLREMVSKENFLEMDVSEGWEPLCRFLDLPIPDVEFPRANDRSTMRGIRSNEIRRNTLTVAAKLMGGIIGVASAGICVWSMYIDAGRASAIAAWLPLNKVFIF